MRGHTSEVLTTVTKFKRVWAMPNKDTFDCEPIGQFVQRYLSESKVSIDPFARNKRWATYINDINPHTKAECHLDAEEFLKMLVTKGVEADLVILDPPYSPRQISECYKTIGLPVDMKTTQNAKLYKRVRNAVLSVIAPDGIVLSFGWNSAGMGLKREFEPLELLLVYHGAGHNDTICLAEKRTTKQEWLL